MVFIDYESLYWSFVKQYNTLPNLADIVEDIKANGKIIKIKVFGDFTKNELNQERNRIRTITSDIIDCGNEQNIQKDFTDFIMLDHIYQEVIQNSSIQQFILITGDGHFASAATFLKNVMDQVVGVYGIRKTLSRQLLECSTWTKAIHVLDDDDEVYRMNLIRIIKRYSDRGKILRFMKTAEFAAEHYHGDGMRYQQIFSDMIRDGYIKYEECTAFRDQTFNILVPDWGRIENDILTKTS